MAKKAYSVYRIRFTDGTEYFGATCQKLEYRVAEHKKESCNPHVRERMDSGMDFEVSLMAQELGKAEAEKLERHYIRSGDNVLNVAGKTKPFTSLNPNMKRTQVDLPKGHVRQIDRICLALNRKSKGLKITRSALLRRWIEDGMDREAQNG